MKETILHNALILFMSFILIGCNNNGQNIEPQNGTTKEVIISKDKEVTPPNVKDDQLGRTYGVDAPVRCTLAKELMEISALTLDVSSGNIYAINDEKAIIYEIEDCNVIGSTKFGKNGDYEGIELVGDQVYALKSNGKLVQYDTKSKKKVKEIDNPLTLSNDTEGLAYDKEKGLLLIACKASPNINKHKKLKKTKSVYSYNIAQDEFIEEPFLTLRVHNIRNYFDKNIDKGWSKKETKRRLQRVLDFSPSGIAKNPIDNNYYMLSTVGKSMMILNERSEILDMMYLDHAAYIQAEGICFDAQGNMYISNEGKGLRSNILTLSY